MNAPTFEQRLKIYKTVLELFNTNPIWFGFCMFLKTAQGVLGFLDENFRPLWHPNNNMDTFFPEIYAYKPKKNYKNSGYWWTVYDVRGKTKRIKILKEIIAKMEAES